MARLAIKATLGVKSSQGSYDNVQVSYFDPSASVTGDVFVGYDNSVITTHSQLAQALAAILRAAGGNTALTK